MPDLRAEKSAVRAGLRARLAALDPSYTAAASAQIVQRLEALPGYLTAGSVLVFVPMAHRPEVDLRPFIRSALAAGKAVALPRTDWPTRTMTARLIQSLESDLEPDAAAPGAGLLQPRAECPASSSIDLLVVPGLGFDTAGGRIGHGAGFYDRFLAQPGIAGSRGLVCGAGFSVQVLPEGQTLPREPHDRVLDALVTESRVRWFGGKEAGRVGPD